MNDRRIAEINTEQCAACESPGATSTRVHLVFDRKNKPEKRFR